MATLQATGKVLKIGKVQEVGEKKFKKRAILIEETIKGKDKDFTNTVYAEFTQDKCAVLDNFKVGQMVEVSINVKSTEYQGKYFTNLNAFAIKEAGSSSSTSKSKVDTFEDSGDLPF